MEWDRTKHQSKETVRDRKRRRQWGRDEHRQSSCISSCHLRGSDQCLIITSTPTARWDSPARPLSPSPSPLVSLMGSPLSPPRPPSSADTIPPPRVATSRNVSRLQVTVRKLWGVNSAESEILFAGKKKKKKHNMCVCVCVDVFPPRSM